MTTHLDNPAVLSSSNSAPISSTVASSATVTSASTTQEASVYQSGENLLESGHRTVNDEAQVPDIPNLPSPLMIPPVPYNRGLTRSFTGTSASLTNVICTSAAEQSVGQSNAAWLTSGYLHLNLDSMRAQVGQQSDTLQGLQSQLTVKAQEVDQLREELSQIDREVMPKLHLPSKEPPVDQYGNVSAGIVGMTLRPSNQENRTGAGTFGIGYAARESATQIEDLRMKLKMTTELCAKQDGYYREVVSDLEDRLNETIAGRDHILGLRENEASNQLQLIHQLEAALRKQKHEDTSKDEVLYSMEAQLRHSDESFSLYRSWFFRISQILHNEERKRGRPGLSLDGASSSDPPILSGDLVIDILQKMLSEDDTQKKTLGIKLEIVEAELIKTREQMEEKHEELQKDHKHKLGRLGEEHSQALTAVSSKSAEAMKELEGLQAETALLKSQHETEVTALDNKVKSLQLELGKTTSQKDKVLHELQNKCKDMEVSVRETKTELDLLKEEKGRLMTDVSQEKANCMVVKEKLLVAEQKAEEQNAKNEKLSTEMKNLNEDYAEEITNLKAELEQMGISMNELHERAEKQRQNDVESTLKDEREKSNARLDGILTEFNRLNGQVSELQANLDDKGTELARYQDDYNKIKEQSEFRERDVSMIRQDKFNLAAKVEDLEKEVASLKEELAAKTDSLKEKSKSFETAEGLIVKLKTQLEEREKTIAKFQEQGATMAEILERNSQTGDSLQREREHLIQTLQERISQVEEMKNHRELLAKKLKAKEKRIRELEEEKLAIEKSHEVKDEKLAAFMDERDNCLAELKLTQVELSKAKEQRDSLSALIEGKDGAREQEISKLLSRLKGSEADLALTRKLLKTKGEVSGKAVRVAESMQKEVTAKRGEVDSLYNKIHWLEENLDSASKDAQYYERKAKELSEKLSEVTLQRDQLNHALHQCQGKGDENQKRAKHLEQALEKAALKHADSQAVIEKLEQDLARLKLKHSLDIKELERNHKAGAVCVRADSVNLAELLNRLNTLRLPVVSSQATGGGGVLPAKTAIQHALPSQVPGAHSAPGSHLIPSELLQGKANQPGSSNKAEEIPATEDLRSLLLDVRTLISTFQAHASQAPLVITPVSSQDAPERTGVTSAERGPSGVSRTQERASEGAPALYLNKGPKKRAPKALVPHPAVKEPKEHRNQRQLESEHGRGIGRINQRQTRTKHRGLWPPESATDLDQNTHQQAKQDRNRTETGLNLTENEIDTDYSLKSEPGDGSDKENGGVAHFRRPLHSSSPKRDDACAAAQSFDAHDRHIPSSVSSLSFDSDDSDITSLLLDQSSVDTVVTRDRRGSGASSASSRVPSDRRSYGLHKPTRFVSKAASSRPKVRHIKTTESDDSAGRRRETRTGSYRRTGFNDRVTESVSRKDLKTGRTEPSANQPVYRRAEMILQSLTSTGDQLTKKNKEIHKLLKEQDKRLKRCRHDEHGIQALLT